MTEIADLSKERLNRMSLDQLINHIGDMTHKVEEFTIRGWIEYIGKFRLGLGVAKQETRDQLIRVHLVEILFLTEEEAAPLGENALLTRVDENRGYYDMRLYRWLKEKYPHNPVVDECRPFKSV